MLFAVTSKPFLKWAGGKTKLVQKLIPILGEGRRLVEPFVGSGAVFMGTGFRSYLLCDSNPDLISLYHNLKCRSDELIALAETLFTPTHNSAEAYYELRQEFNERQSSDIRKSALFVYLNKHGFNGLCRYNSRGHFNVPFGKYHSPKLPKREMILFAGKSEIAEFKCIDFTETYKLLQEGDVVYCDPPYVPLSSTANFTSYTSGAFNHEDQMRLVSCASEAALSNIRTVISNHDTPFTRTLYQAAQLTSVSVQRSISSKAETRGAAQELLAVF